MGLDIVAYSNVRQINAEYDKYDDIIDLVTKERIEKSDRFTVFGEYKDRAPGIEEGAFYTYDTAFRFRAGSYGGYNDWREQLARLAGYPEAPAPLRNPNRAYSTSAWAATKGPFWELINFSDCEGTIAGEVCAKLANDFAAFHEAADRLRGADWAYFSAKYSEWRRAFELASYTGAVKFQ